MNQAAFQALADSLPEPMLLVTTSGEVLAANAALGRRLARPPATLAGLPLQQLLTDAPQAVAAYLQRCARSSQVLPGALTLRAEPALRCRAEGARVAAGTSPGGAWLVLRLRPRIDDASPFGLLNRRIDSLARGLAREMAQRQHAETEARREQERAANELSAARLLAAIVEHSSDAILRTGLDGTIQSWNAGAERLFGLAAADVVGRHVSLLIPADRLPEEARIVERIRQGERVEPYDTLRQRIDGSAVPVSLSASPLVDDAGRVVGVAKILRDVTRQRLAEAKLAQTLTFYRSTIDALSGHIAVLDETGVVLEVNLAWRRFATDNGMRWADHGVGRNYLGACSGGVLQGLRDVMGGIRTVYSVEYPCHAPHIQRWFVMRVTRFLAGDRARAVVVHEDISDRVRHESTLRQRSTQLARLVEVGRLGGDDYFRGLVRALADILRVRRVVLAEQLSGAAGGGLRGLAAVDNGQLVGADFTLSHHTPILQRALAHDGPCLLPVDADWPAELGTPALGLRYGLVVAIRGPDGQQRGLLALASEQPLDEALQPAAIAALAAGQAAAELTRLQQARALHDSERKLRLIAEHSADLIFAYDQNRRLLYVNPAVEALLGMTPAQFAQHDALALLHPDDRPVIAGRLAAAYRGQASQDVEFRLITTTGQSKWCAGSWGPLRDADGLQVGVQGRAHDITERKRAEQERDELLAREQAARIALARSDQLKTEFLATLAHELRNPLAPVRTAVQLLLRLGRSQTELERASLVIDRQVRQMARLLDDLLDISRISRGQLSLQREHLPLAQVVASAVETSQPLISQRGHRLRVALPESAVVVDADPTRLAQVLANLLNNAAKYTPDGGDIALDARVESGWLHLSVTDSGIGLSADHLQSIFQMFSQVESALARAGGGLGIGLALVQRLVQLHGGSISAHSAGPGRGSEFRLALPIVVDSPVSLALPASLPASLPADLPVSLPVPLPAPAPSPPPVPSPWRVLVVDDNHDAADTLVELLSLEGCQTASAGDGVAAVRLAAEFQPHVVVLDIGLPGMNGYEACRRIRQGPGGDAMALIALTGWGQDEDRRRSAEAGFDDHLVKPVDPEALLSRVLEMARQVGQRHGSDRTTG